MNSKIVFVEIFSGIVESNTTLTKVNATEIASTLYSKYKNGDILQSDVNPSGYSSLIDINIITFSGKKYN
jgi:hypothetical protein